MIMKELLKKYSRWVLGFLVFVCIPALMVLIYMMFVNGLLAQIAIWAFIIFCLYAIASFFG
mgnify:CR=1